MIGPCKCRECKPRLNGFRADVEPHTYTATPETVEAPEPESILEEAQRLVHGDRQADYGHPLDNWTLTADLCNPIIKRAIAEKGHLNAEDLLKVMVQVKVAREVNAGKRDNRTDICGYTECLDMVIAERARREAK